MRRLTLVNIAICWSPLCIVYLGLEGQDHPIHYKKHAGLALEDHVEAYDRIPTAGVVSAIDQGYRHGSCKVSAQSRQDPRDPSGQGIEESPSCPRLRYKR